MMNFFISNNSYSKWFKSDYYVLYSISLIDIPEPLTQCEKLFDKNVLPIKKLVKGIGDLNNLTIKETKNYFYMMTVISLVIHFLQNLRKYNVMILFRYSIITAIKSW